MTFHPRVTSGLRPLGACLSAALTVLGIALTSGSPVQATPPVASIAVTVPAAQGGETGTIKGKLVWGGAEAPAPKVLEQQGQASKDPNVCAKDAPIVDSKLTVDPATKGVQYAFAYLVKPTANPEAVKGLVEKTPKVVLDQKGCVFVPHSVALNQEQELVFKSSDPVNHNVHLAAFTNQPFNTLLPANGEMTKKLVAEKRAMPLTCDIHPWMKANIMVFDHAFFAVTDKDGSFEIKGVPAGTQKLVIWQESTGFVTPGFGAGMAVEVSPGKETNVGEIKLDPAKVKS